MSDLLDNPAWSALTTVHAAFAEGKQGARRYRKGVLPFAALGPGGQPEELDALMDIGERFYLIGDLPELLPNWVLELELPCVQLMKPEYFDPVSIKEQIVYLGEADKQEMFELIDRVQPGYYLPDTHRLGYYFGIRINGRLAAMAGERMRLPGCSEISAVCTLPEFTGRGYAQQLLTRLIEEQNGLGVSSFLHVSQANQRALRLYEHLGFRRRREISFYRLQKTRP